MEIMSLNQQLKRVEIKEVEITNDVVFNFFQNIPAKDRSETFFRAIYIGVLALMEDRFSSFLAKTSDELGTKLESLKMIFDMKKEIFYKTAVKGISAEDEISTFLNDFFETRGLKDKAKLAGTTVGKIPQNKTGDIICEIDGNPALTIVIEVKFDKSIRQGEIDTKDVFSRKADTAWSQLLEAQANRESRIALIVFDVSLIDPGIFKSFEGVGYLPRIGFVSIVDSQKGDYRNLLIAYLLARDIIINAKTMDFHKETLVLIVRRIIKELNTMFRIKQLVEANISNDLEILKQLEKSLLIMQFTEEYLERFLKEGKLSAEDLLKFYNADDVRERYSMIEKKIEQLYTKE